MSLPTIHAAPAMSSTRDATRMYDLRTKRLRLATWPKRCPMLPNIAVRARYWRCFDLGIFLPEDYNDAPRCLCLNSAFKRDGRKGVVLGPNCKPNEEGRCEENRSTRILQNLRRRSRYAHLRRDRSHRAMTRRSRIPDRAGSATRACGSDSSAPPKTPPDRAR